ncbi:BTAD domain-containing putative transcriptional regulator [Rubrivivax albus]|nr:BTAD domain-containing putative transcriptional regulator [Rubrivivax albus]
MTPRTAGSAPSASTGARADAALGTATFELHLLGTPQVIGPSGAVHAVSRKVLCLLAYVSLEGPSSRERLAGLFWADLDHGTARRNLRRELHRLREAGLEDMLADAGDRVALRSVVVTDVGRFEEALAQGDLAAALRLYGGPLLDGRHGRDADLLASWVTSWRERLAQRFREAVEAQVSLHEAAGHWREALVCQLRLLEVDLPQEAHVRAAMRLHARLGEREAALKLFERCRRQLGQELGLRPMPETLCLAEDIRVGSRHEATPPAPSPAAPRLPGALPLVGRDGLLRRLAASLAGGRTVWLVGEAGVGKTRLAAEAVAVRGPSWTLQARPGDAQVPYAPAIRALRAAPGGPGALELPAWAASVLAHLLPELGTSGAALDTDADRARLQAALALALRQTWPASLATVVLDDWHLADRASQDFWVGRPDAGPWPGQASAGLALLVIARDADTSVAQRDALLRAQRAGQAETIDVPPLDAGATRELLGWMVPDQAARAGEGFAGRLQRATGGNPFFILETLRQWPTGTVGHGQDDALPLPPTVRDAILARLDRLDAATRRLLEAASLTGLPFRLEDLDGTTALSALEAVQAVEQACDQRVLVAGGDGLLSFAHDLVAQTLAEGLGAERRRLLHRRLAQALERQGGTPARLAQHLEAAGEAQRALQARLAAADAAAAVSAHDDALTHLTAALAQASSAADRLTVQMRRARLLQRASRNAEADAAFDAAEEAALAAGDGAGAVAVALSRAEHQACSNRGDAALATVDGLLDDDLLAPLQQGEALEVRADVFMRQGRLAEAADALRAALAALPPGPTAVRGRVLTALGRAALYQGAFAEASGWLDKAVRVQTVLGAQEPLARALFMRGAALLHLGRFDEAVAVLERARTHAAQVGSVPVQRGALLNLVKIHTQRGEVDRAVACLDEGEALSPLYESLEAEGAFLQARYYCRALRGEVGAALAMIPAVLAHADRCTELYWQVGARQLVVDLLLLTGDLTRAGELLTDAERLCDGDRDGHHRPLVVAKRAWWTLLQGDPAAAVAQLAALGPCQDMAMLEAQDVRRHVEAAALLALGDATGALAAVTAPDQASTEESKALQWAARVRAEAAAGGVTAPTAAAVSALLAAEARLPALEALALRQAWAAGCSAGQGQGAVDVEARRQALVASLGDAWGQRSPAGVLAAGPVLAR